MKYIILIGLWGVFALDALAQCTLEQATSFEEDANTYCTCMHEQGYGAASQFYAALLTKYGLEPAVIDPKLVNALQGHKYFIDESSLCEAHLWGNEYADSNFVPVSGNEEFLMPLIEPENAESDEELEAAKAKAEADWAAAMEEMGKGMREVFTKAMEDQMTEQSEEVREACSLPATTTLKEDAERVCECEWKYAISAGDVTAMLTQKYGWEFFSDGTMREFMNLYEHTKYYREEAGCQTDENHKKYEQSKKKARKNMLESSKIRQEAHREELIQKQVEGGKSRKEATREVDEMLKSVEKVIEEAIEEAVEE